LANVVILDNIVIFFKNSACGAFLPKKCAFFHSNVFSKKDENQTQNF
jgi:hypothetical protein